MENIIKVEYNGKPYKMFQGTYYNIETPDEVIKVIQTAKDGNVRIVLDYGDIKTGKSWGEQYDITGYVGRSTGEVKIPLLIHNTRSMGGGAILTHCIIKIVRSNDKKRVLYQHPSYQPYQPKLK